MSNINLDGSEGVKNNAEFPLLHTTALETETSLETALDVQSYLLADSQPGPSTSRLKC